MNKKCAFDDFANKIDKCKSRDEINKVLDAAVKFFPSDFRPLPASYGDISNVYLIDGQIELANLFYFAHLKTSAKCADR